MRGRPFAIMAIICSTFGIPRAAADPYDDALARAARLAEAGHAAEAARGLEEALASYPQDYALPVEIARLHLLAGHLGDAERFYRLALERSPGGAEARLGLGLTWERQGRCAEARPLLEALSTERPDLAAAREAALRCSTTTLRITPEVAFLGAAYPRHPTRSWAAGVGAGASLAHRSGFFLGGAYRYLRFWPNARTAAAAASAWDQHEAHAAAGFDGKLGGVSLHYAFVRDGSGVTGSSHHAGIVLRYSPYGDIDLSGAVSIYDDMKILRVEHGYRIPIALGLAIRPAVAVALAQGEVLPTALCTLSFDHRLFRLYAGAKVGDELRPVYFQVPLVYAVTERIPWGAYAGATVNATDHVRIHLGYATDRLELGPEKATSSHSLSVGASFPF